MNRIEPNLLLAVSTAFGLALLVMTASLFGEPGNTLKYVLSAVLCASLYMALNGWMARVTNRPEPKPLVRLDAPTALAWAGLFPMFMVLAAAVPVFFSGHDYGLLVIIGAVWFGVTADSAIRARKA